METNIKFSDQDKKLVYYKIFSVVSLYGNMMLGFDNFFSWLSSDQADLWFNMLTRLIFIISTFSATGFLGLVEVHYAYDTRVIEQKLRLIESEAAI